MAYLIEAYARLEKSAQPPLPHPLNYDHERKKKKKKSSIVRRCASKTVNSIIDNVPES